MLGSYLEIAANKLKNGVKVYLGPACMETALIAKMLRKQYAVLPVGFCDNDSRKQGKYLKSLPELKMVSFDEALADEHSEFLIVSPHHSAEIIGDLVLERGVPETRILNFHPVERVKTCALFAQNWIIRENNFYCCCMKNAPLFHHENHPEKSVEYLDKTRKGFIDGSIPLPTICTTCFHNKNCYIYTSRRLNSFNFSFRGWCNYKCAYCSASRPDRKQYNDKFSLVEYLIELEKRDMVNDIFSVLFAVGEPCLNEKRFPLYDLCEEKKYFLDVFSNCSVFDQSLCELAQASPVIIRKSFDAGTRQTYAKIKGVDCWEKMLKNIASYLKAPYLALNPKYLFMPGINDNETDIKNFVRLCADWNVDFVTPVFSILDNQYSDSNHAKKMFKLLVDELLEHNIFTANVDTLYSESYHKLYAASF